MAGRRPLIGVTGPDQGGLMAWWMTALALRRCGARALRLTPGRARTTSQLDGLVVGGGSDVDPFHYDEEPLAIDSREHSSPLDWLVGLVLSLFRAVFARHSRQDYDPARDELEKRLIAQALAQQLPVLGICRGAQLLNVVLGGSLHQDIKHLYTEGTSHIRSILPRKPVAISAQTHLHRILATDSCEVNALHDQSIKQLGEKLLVSAVEPNGVVQAIELRDHPFLIGVQWHPEYIPQSRTQQALFQELVLRARNRVPECAANVPTGAADQVP